MKKLIETETVVKTKRRIDIEKIEGTDFAYYVDTRDINTDGTLETKEYKGVTSLENLKTVKKMEKINDIVVAPKMYEKDAIIVAIDKKDFQQVLNGKKHITDIIENTQINDLSFPISNNYMLILWNWKSYEIADLFYNFIPLPIKLNYMNGAIDNERYDLEKLLKKLKKDKHVIDRENLRIKNIPSYNADEGRDKTIEFLYLLDKEDYQKIAEMDDFDIPYYVLKEFIGADKFKINKD